MLYCSSSSIVSFVPKRNCCNYKYLRKMFSLETFFNRSKYFSNILFNFLLSVQWIVYLSAWDKKISSICLCDCLIAEDLESTIGSKNIEQKLRNLHELKVIRNKKRKTIWQSADTQQFNVIPIRIVLFFFFLVVIVLLFVDQARGKTASHHTSNLQYFILIDCKIRICNLSYLTLNSCLQLQVI